MALNAGIGPVDIIGTGVAGLSAALVLVGRGVPVRLFEAAPHAGGRCRSWEEPALGTLDNGTHLILSGNSAVSRYLARCGSTDELPADPPCYQFMDLSTGHRWQWNLRRPWQLGLAGLSDILRLLCHPDRTVAAVLAGSPHWRTLWQPLAVAALNTDPIEASARSLRAILTGSLLRGPAACCPRLARRSLNAAFIAPALAHLPPVSHHQRLDRLILTGGRVTGLAFRSGLTLASRRVILAVPAFEAARLLPSLTLPQDWRAIVNFHVRVGDTGTPGPRLLGLAGGLSEWLSVRDGVASITISSANALLDQPDETLAARLWPEVARALSLPGPPPLPDGWRIIREKRATLAATATTDRLRPAATAGPAGVMLAGDWTATGLPGTLEGACRSGETAARLSLLN